MFIRKEINLALENQFGSLTLKEQRRYPVKKKYNKSSELKSIQSLLFNLSSNSLIFFFLPTFFISQTSLLPFCKIRNFKISSSVKTTSSDRLILLFLFSFCLIILSFILLNFIFKNIHFSIL